MKLEPNARSIAAYVLERVYGEDAFAAAVLDAALDRYPELDPREKGLATEIAYGTLRTAPHLETRLSKHARRGTSKLDRSVRAHLLVAAYQLLFLERVPAFAAVSEGVRQISALRGRQVGAFANAVLRRLADEAKDSDKRAALDIAIRESVSRELHDALVRSIGEADANALLGSATSPGVGLRVRWGNDRNATLEDLRRAVPGATFEEGRASPLALSMRGGSDPQKLALFREGRVVVQEEGAQVVALSLGASSGDVILDACAGRGNKTALLAEMVGPSGAVDAADQHPQKLERLQSELARVGLSARSTLAVDWTIGAGDVPSGYDRVLVDAPCSGTGTIGRRPDLATRWRASEVAGICDVQTKILLAASERVKPGGAVVYAVCSVLREEGEDVIRQVLECAPWLASAEFPTELGRRLSGGASTVRLTPSSHGTDGYFLASLTRKPGG